MKKKFDPTPRSPVDASQDPDYEVMNDYATAHYWLSGSEIIVKHKASNTFWRTVYAVRDDNSDADFSATWRQVYPKKITITEYNDKE